ncbi:MAG: 23S rRNA (uracil(1939)-C(5))-methyltransferase RlmD, partial [Desulfuromonadaceae bacterium]|nr:23S rRNA (uracil(1939)-C(5))-methyltransferase RlmD [Desulfuromonadaceae bacterium]
ALRTLLAPTAFAGEIPQIDLAVGDEGAARAVVHYLGVDRAALADLLRQLTDDSLDVLIKTGRKNPLYPVRGHGELRIEVDQPPIKLTCAAGGFAQINLQQNRQLVDSVIKTADLRGKERILDLYCGMGNFSLPLARRAAWVCGVENSAPSIDMAKRNAELNLLEHVEFHSRPAEGALSFFSRQDSFDVVLLDPPRAGAHAVMQELLKNPVPRVIYVSCDPQTLARDLKSLLQGGYRLVSSQPFDLFPQTYHVESLTLLEYRAA